MKRQNKKDINSFHSSHKRRTRASIFDLIISNRKRRLLFEFYKPYDDFNLLLFNIMVICENWVTFLVRGTENNVRKNENSECNCENKKLFCDAMCKAMFRTFYTRTYF